MDHHPQAPRALRWCVVRADDSLLALEHANGETFFYSLTVDSAQRMVRSGAKSALQVPSGSLPSDAALVAATRVDDHQLAVPVTLVVYRRVSTVDTSTSQRPAKRARRTSSSSSQASQPTDGASSSATRLLVYVLTSDGDGAAGSGWSLQSMGDVVLAGDASSLHVHVVDGPSIVAFNGATRELTLLQTASLGDGEYGFHVTRVGLTLPADELVSCQLVDDTATPTPHLLLQYLPIQSRGQQHDDRDFGSNLSPTLHWESTTDARAWATLRIGEDQKSTGVEPCAYLPSRFQGDVGVGVAEFVTSCTFVTTTPSQSARPLSALSTSNTRPVQLYPFVTVLVGTSSSTVHVIANDVTLSTFVVAGIPQKISVTDAYLSSSLETTSSLEVSVQCGDTDRSFHLLSINMLSPKQRFIAPMQHFTFVGSMFELPDEVSTSGTRLVFVNNVDSIVEGDFLQFLLRKSVLVLSEGGNESKHSTSSCHRLKYRADDKAKKKRAVARRSNAEEDSFQCIERVKFDKRDFDLDSPAANNKSSASEQQLQLLTNSLEERLRVGHDQTNRLELVCKEKMGMIVQLNRLLVASDDEGDSRDLITPSRQQVDVKTAFDLVHVVSLVTPQDSDDRDDIVLEATTPTSIPAITPVLEKVLIQSFERSTSILRLLLDLRVSTGSGEGCDVNEATTSDAMAVFALEHTNAAPPLRSYSRVLEVSLLPPIDGWCHSRVRIEVAINVPQGHVRSKDDPLRFGLWARRESKASSIANMPATSAVSSQLVGEVEVDLVSLFDKLGCGGDLSSSVDFDFDSHRDEYLLLSGGSSIRECVGSTTAKSRSASLKTIIVRPRFAVVTAPTRLADEAYNSSDHAVGTLLRMIPRDVIPMVNPLSKSSLKIAEQLIALLQSEIDCLHALENPTDDEQIMLAGRLLKTQSKTDLQAVQLLNELQRRINFHSTWRLSSKTSSMT